MLWRWAWEEDVGKDHERGGGGSLGGREDFLFPPFSYFFPSLSIGIGAEWSGAVALDYTYIKKERDGCKYSDPERLRFSISKELNFPCSGCEFALFLFLMRGWGFFTNNPAGWTAGVPVYLFVCERGEGGRGWIYDSSTPPLLPLL